jgi:hypothetical protein
VHLNQGLGCTLRMGMATGGTSPPAPFGLADAGQNLRRLITRADPASTASPKPAQITDRAVLPRLQFYQFTAP